MTFLGWIASFFPVIHLSLIAYSLFLFWSKPSLFTVCAVLLNVYIVPPVVARVYSWRYPGRPGRWILNRPERCDWWFMHQLQLIYAALPMLESVLRVLPGVYSAWLRLWGSEVGKRVYWTPLVEIVDRHMLRIGDDVVFGHRVICTSHIIKRKPTGDLVLILRPIHIGSGAFLGALARLGPGVRIPDGAVVAFNSEHRFRYAE